MSKPEKRHVIGIMDPNSLSFRNALEGLIDYIQPRIEWEGETHMVVHRRIICRPYEATGVTTSCNAILNRGAHWNPHHNSFFMAVRDQTYLLNDMISLLGIIKNTAYNHMHQFGMKIPKTAALPQFDNSALKENKNELELSLIFSEYEMFDLAEVGEEIGYPAFLKPQDGGGWIGVEKVDNVAELHQKYAESGDKPMNLQAAVDYREFVRTVGVGPQFFPMHYNASADHSHDRYFRGGDQLIEPDFITPEERDEIVKISKTINAFYGWDHNSCETLIAKDGNLHPIDYCNAYPDSNLISLHYWFPEVVKAMVKWFLFVVVTGKQKPLDFAYDWERYFAIAEKHQSGKLDYREALDRYAALADEHFETEKFEKFCSEALGDKFEKLAYEYFAGSDFKHLIDTQVEQYFKIPYERPVKTELYRKIQGIWLAKEKARLGL